MDQAKLIALGSVAQPYHPIAIPNTEPVEFVYARRLRKDERDQYVTALAKQEYAKATGIMLALALVDEEGNRLFPDTKQETLAKIGQLDCVMLEHLFVEASNYNGVSAEDRDELKKRQAISGN